MIGVIVVLMTFAFLFFNFSLSAQGLLEKSHFGEGRSK
jgi:hypothetical protein